MKLNTVRQAWLSNIPAIFCVQYMMSVVLRRVDLARVHTTIEAYCLQQNARTQYVILIVFVTDQRLYCGSFASGHGFLGEISLISMNVFSHFRQYQ